MRSTADGTLTVPFSRGTSLSMIAAMTLACDVPSNAFRPESIS